MYYDDTVAGAASATAGLISLVLYIGIYALMCFFLYRIFTKLKSTKAWMAIIPVVNVLYFIWLGLKRDQKWMIILLVIPFVNLALIVYTTYQLLKHMEKNPWALLLMLIPGFGPLILMGYMAY